MAELSKFDELRIKTGKQLGQLINHELDLGTRDARQALKSADTWAAAEASYLRAKRAYAQVSLLIPLVAEITEDERGRAETRLEHLNGMLNALSAIGSTPTPTEDEITALARTLWRSKRLP